MVSDLWPTVLGHKVFGAAPATSLWTKWSPRGRQAVGDWSPSDWWLVTITFPTFLFLFRSHGYCWLLVARCSVAEGLPRFPFKLLPLFTVNLRFSEGAITKTHERCINKIHIHNSQHTNGSWKENTKSHKTSIGSMDDLKPNNANSLPQWWY